MAISNLGREQKLEAERNFKEAKDQIENKIGRNLIKKIEKLMIDNPVESWAPELPLCYKSKGVYKTDEVC